MLARHPYLALYLSSLFFAVMALAVKLATGGPHAEAGPAWAWFRAQAIPPLEVAFYRSLLPLFILLPMAMAEVRRNRKTAGRLREARGVVVGRASRGNTAWPAPPSRAPLRSLSRAGLGWLLLLRGLSGGLAMVFYFVAIQDLGVSTAVVLNYTSPLWATLFSAWFLGEAVPRRVLWAFPVAFLGVLLTVRPEVRLLGEGPALPGYLMGLGSGVLAGVAYVSVRRLSAEISPAMIVFTFSGITCVLVLPWMGSNYVAPDPGGWFLLAVAGLSASVAQMLMTFGYKLNSASRASTMTLATVAFSALAAVALLGERPDPVEWLGLALTVAGVAAAATGKAETLEVDR